MTLLDRAFAALYDPVMARAERGALGRWRAELLGGVSGAVLEVGAGTGANLGHYGGVARLVLTEPEPAMRERLARRVASSPHPDAEVVDAAAESLPFPDAAFDVAVSTLVLCSVRDPTRSLEELHRVLRPGGQLLFIEHVGSHAGCERVLHAAIEPVWKVAARGCHLTRDTERAIRAAGFEVSQISAERLPGAGLPSVRGVANR